jgi:uncharacterized protein (TIRG00374 family)
MRKIHRPMMVAAGFAFSVGALAVALRGVEWSGVRAALGRMDSARLLVVVGFVVAGLAMRAERWRLVAMQAFGRLAAHRATGLGFVFNYIYPARAGDVLKVLYLHRTAGTALGRLAISAIADRVVDVIVLLLGSAAVLLLRPHLELGKAPFYAVAGALMAGVAFAFSNPGRAMLEALDRWIVTRLNHRIGRIVRNALKAFLEFRAEILNVQGLATHLVALSALVAICDYGAISFLGLAFGWELPALAPVVVWVAIAIGASLPSAPAGIGIHQLACLVSLTMFQVAAADAFAFSIVLQAATLAGILLYAGAAFVVGPRRGVR